MGNGAAISHQSARMRGQPEIDDWKLADVGMCIGSAEQREGYREVFKSGACPFSFYKFDSWNLLLEIILDTI